MSPLLIAASVLLLALLLWWLMRRRGVGTGATGSATSDRIDTLIGWPPQAMRILTSQERIAYGTLTRALPDHMVLAQVPLARFLNVAKRQSYTDWLRRIGYQCVDFVVCDMSSQVVAAIDLQSSSPQINERARKRQTRMARTLKAAKIPLLVWFENSLPGTEAAREAVLQQAAVRAEAEAAAVPAASYPAASTTRQPEPAQPGTNPFADTDRDSAQDERIEVLEPPASTWFDELETAPAPLTASQRPKR
ncbi:MAG: DUF2726 domain-containing protein [Burkholderiaceae bacterium]